MAAPLAAMESKLFARANLGKGIDAVARGRQVRTGGPN